jgi:hypothetical protein
MAATKIKDEINLYCVIRGDHSVGIPDAVFTIENVGAMLDDTAHRNQVRMAFHTAFSVLCDEPMTLTFSDERDDEEAQS